MDFVLELLFENMHPLAKTRDSRARQRIRGHHSDGRGWWCRSKIDDVHVDAIVSGEFIM